MSSRRSLVTGGGGFIGSHLVQQLLERGETVRALELPGVSLPSSIEVVRGSVCEGK
ncbi:MAG: GDP-mannose 4,6-dehydratase, partial [Nitrosomonas sp.]|nr:GDP-mannose 4,6-dehydratase [Nitrosomonas sp.]